MVGNCASPTCRQAYIPINDSFESEISTMCFITVSYLSPGVTFQQLMISCNVTNSITKQCKLGPDQKVALAQRSHDERKQISTADWSKCRRVSSATSRGVSSG